MAQRSFMSSTPHRNSQLAAYERFGCGTATVPGSTAGSTRTYFACLFSNGGSSTWSPAPSPTPAPTLEPAPTPTPTPTPTPPVDAVAMVPACDGVNLRTDAATTAPAAARLASGTPVTVDLTVAGGAWSTDCDGRKSGSSWYRVTHVNGTPVATLYGVAALYAATGVLMPASTGAAGGATQLGAAVTFFGRGYGHGVGLSQYGARGRALAGQGTAEILAHYYPGTTIGLLPFSPAIRVLLLDDRAASATSPLVVVGRGDAWAIDGIPGIFPADARLRLFPPAASGAAWRAVVDAGATTFYDGPAPKDFRIAGSSEAATFQLPARAATYNVYRGTLRVILSSSKADVVNELPLEAYLRGVVPAEMPSSWPLAARAAQTIAARSYAAYRLRPGVSTFDVYDDTRSQVYRGVRGETAAADAVVAETAGQVLLHGATVANALFHSTGGGATEHNENVYVSASGGRTATPVAYLRGSPDRDEAGAAYDAAAPYATWQTATYAPADLSAIFAADARTNVGTLTALDLRDRGVSGRLVSVTLVGTAGSKTVSGGVFVAVFNAHRPAGALPMRSTLLDLAPIP
jgi:SpoIID/LytB domain protein